MTRPTRVWMSLDNYRLELLNQEDLTTCLSLLSLDTNTALIEGIKLSEEDIQSFLDFAQLDLWSIPVICLYDNQPIGFLLTMNSNMQSLNTRLVTVFTHPQQSKLPFLLYLRQLFWSFPLRRIYAHIPSLVPHYLDLYLSVGFQHEGVYRQRQVINGMLYDVNVLGLLRQDFEQWCHIYDPRVALE
jgi:hypothetical protein